MAASRMSYRLFRHIHQRMRDAIIAKRIDVRVYEPYLCIQYILHAFPFDSFNFISKLNLVIV